MQSRTVYGRHNKALKTSTKLAKPCPRANDQELCPATLEIMHKYSERRREKVSGLAIPTNIAPEETKKDSSRLNAVQNRFWQAQQSVKNVNKATQTLPPALITKNCDLQHLKYFINIPNVEGGNLAVSNTANSCARGTQKNLKKV